MKSNEKFRYVRELRQLTLQELSNKCDLSVPYLSDIENGKKSPAMKSLTRIAKALSADVAFFIDDKATTFQELAKVSNYNMSDDIMKFVTDQDKLSYIVLAKELSDKGISPEAFKLMLDNIKLMMQSLNK